MNAQTISRRRSTVGFASMVVVSAVVILAASSSFGDWSTGSALGPVRAITPVQTSPQLTTGREADLSRRGEAVAATSFTGEFSPSAGAFIGLDDATIDTPFPAEHIGVSGDGCLAAYVVSNFATSAVLAGLPPSGMTRIGTVDRCNPANSRVLLQAPISEGPFGQPVVDFDGSTIVVPIASRVVRFDIGASVVATDLPIGSVPGFVPVVDDFGSREFGNSVDVAADGSVVVATLSDNCNCATPVTVIVGWEDGAPSVQVLSTVSGAPAGSAVSPSVSGDGRYVSFVSTTRLAGQSISQTGPWVYVRPRIAPAFTLLSGADERARYSSISEDGSQVAFMRTQIACAAEFPAAGCVANPDQLISVVWSPLPGLTGAVQREDVNIAAGGVDGRHRAPVLSGNGRYVAWETQGGAALLGDPGFPENFQVVMRQREVGLTVGAIAFGSIPTGTSLIRTSTVTNIGRSSILPGDIVTTSPTFAITGGTCSSLAWIPPGATCTVDVRFDAPAVGGAANAELIVSENGFEAVSATGGLTGISTTPPGDSSSTTTTSTSSTSTTTLPPPASAPTPTVALSASPNPLDFGPVAVGIPTALLEVTVANSGNGAGEIQLVITGEHATDFEIVSESCRLTPLVAGATCGVRIRMVATTGGDRQAALDIVSTGASASVTLRGQGRLAPQLAASPASISERGFTTIIGQGFIPGESVTVDVVAPVAGSSILSLSATVDTSGIIQVPLSSFGQLPLGSYELVVAARPDAYDEVRSTLLVALGTYQPQGPTSAVFGDNALVARGN